MLTNLLKTVTKSYRISLRSTIPRNLSSHNDVNAKTPLAKDREDEVAALKIEASLFDNASIKYMPTKKEEIVQLSKMKQKLIQSKTKEDIISRPRQFPSFKKYLGSKCESKLINDSELGLEFLKLSLNDPRLNTLLITARSKKRRDKNRQIIVEGRRLILEALECGLKLQSILFSRKEQLAEIKESVARAQQEFSATIYKVPHHDLKTWSTLNTSPGVMAIFERPQQNHIIKNMVSTLPITVVCDNIREPNNLGSIIRTCAALPCLQIVVTRGCCDPWDSKALRGGCGGHFRLPIRDDIDWKEVPLTIPPELADNCYIFIAENNVEKLRNQSTLIEYSEIPKIGSHNIVIIGGESHGVSEEAYRFMETVGERGKCLYIPLAQGIDSLNVVSALTLILFELQKNIKSQTVTEKEVI